MKNIFRSKQINLRSDALLYLANMNLLKATDQQQEDFHLAGCETENEARPSAHFEQREDNAHRKYNMGGKPATNFLSEQKYRIKVLHSRCSASQTWSEIHISGK